MDEYNIAEEFMNSFSSFAEIVEQRRIWQYKDDNFTMEILRIPSLPGFQPHEIADYRLNIYFSSMYLYDPEEGHRTCVANLSMGNDLKELKKDFLIWLILWKTQNITSFWSPLYQRYFLVNIS